MNLTYRENKPQPRQTPLRLEEHHNVSTSDGLRMMELGYKMQKWFV